MFAIFNLFKKRPLKEQAAAPAAAAPQVAAPVTEEDWARLRAPQFGHEKALSGWTRGWLQALPDAVFPVELSARHPHVANRLALSWRDAALTEHLLDELLIGRRKGRKGFSPPVIAELMRLRDFHARAHAVPTRGAASRGVAQAAPQVAIAQSDWAHLRGPKRTIDLVLSSMAEDWLETLPRPIRPTELCAAYPRVANRLALCWNDPALTERLLDDLLIGRRGKRKGFARPIAEELLRLRRFHDHYRGIEVQETVWEYRMLAVSDR